MDKAVMKKRSFLQLSPWGIVLLLSALYIVSLLDRQIIALVADPVARSLEVSDTQIGILYGLGFGLLYTLVGFPAAHYIDRNPRIGIVAAGVLLWSVCTIGSGFAATFLVLLILRSGVAIGEAVLTPAAVSIIGDVFPAEKRALPMAVYASAGAVMSSGSFFVGGAIYACASQISAPDGFEPWRLTLFLVGLPGIVLASIFWLCTSEPQRQASLDDDKSYDTIAAAVDYAKGEARFYAPFLISIAAVQMMAAGFVTWTPTILVRLYGFEVASAGVAIGTLGMAAVSTGAFLWPMLASWLTNAGRKDGLILSFLLAQVVGLSALVLATLANDHTLFLAMLGTSLFCMASLGALPPLAIQTIAPARMRARMSSLYLLAASIGGVVIGPPLIALVSDTFFVGPGALASAGFAVVSLCAAPAVLLMLSSRKHYAEAYSKALN